MGPAPSELEGAKVIATAIVEGAVRATGATIHKGPDGVVPPASALAIVAGDPLSLIYALKPTVTIESLAQVDAGIVLLNANLTMISK